MLFCPLLGGKKQKLFLLVVWVILFSLFLGIDICLKMTAFKRKIIYQFSLFFIILVQGNTTENDQIQKISEREKNMSGESDIDNLKQCMTLKAEASGFLHQ
jgi:hypothetical protein